VINSSLEFSPICVDKPDHFHTTFGLPYHYLVNQWTEADGMEQELNFILFFFNAAISSSRVFYKLDK
jgi:hypothetical protein